MDESRSDRPKRVSQPQDSPHAPPGHPQQQQNGAHDQGTRLEHDPTQRRAAPSHAEKSRPWPKRIRRRPECEHSEPYAAPRSHERPYLVVTR